MKARLDCLVKDRGLAESREKAKALIMSGRIYVNGQKAEKAGQDYEDDSDIELRGGSDFVSRGGKKLEKALDYFAVDPAGLTFIDCGASTGGFTDCLLSRGARRVYAIDVGYGQLAWKLRNDERVVCMERRNIRHVTPEDLGELTDMAALDLSFISLRLVLPVVKTLLKPEGRVICLIKPQFEAGRGAVGKNGVVREPETHIAVLEHFLVDAENAGFCCSGMTYSPIRGPEGNIEFLAYLGGKPCKTDIKALVLKAHESGV